MEELSLVEKAAGHDQEAFSMLMQKHSQSMYKIALAILKNNDDAADAMQETALSCWEKISTLQKKQYFRTWMVRILINHCNTIYRQKKKYIPTKEMPQEPAKRTGYEDIEWMQMLECLKEKYRIVVVLYYAEEFSVKDIADMLHIGQSTVKQRLFMARKELKKQFGYLQESHCISDAKCL